MNAETGIQIAIIRNLLQRESEGQPIIGARTAVFKGFIYVPRTGRMVKVRMETGRAGWPDITCCIAGKFVGIEVKTETGSVDTEQRKIHKKIVDAGGEVWVMRSFEEYERVLDAFLLDRGHTRMGV